jgi:hypothetical protein
MTANYHTPKVAGFAANASEINTPLGELDAAIGTQGGGADALSNYLFAHWQDALGRMTGNPTYDVTYTDVIKTVNVTWPDGSAGVYTATTIDGTWLEPTALSLTHVDSGLTLTGGGLVRNANGQITTRMTLSVA